MIAGRDFKKSLDSFDRPRPRSKLTRQPESLVIRTQLQLSFSGEIDFINLGVFSTTIELLATKDLDSG